MIGTVAERHFTPEEANEALAEVRPLAERLVAHRRALGTAQMQRAEALVSIAGNGGRVDSGELPRFEAEVQRAAAGVAACVEALNELGVVVKDPDEGLVDFPSLRDGEEVLLCWRAGEDAVEYWHGLDEGFAGRKRI
jgi:hypothetical protein